MTNRSPVPFRWAALTLSSLVVPAPFGLAGAGGAAHPVYAFVVCAFIGYVLALAIIAVLLLPALWILSWIVPVKGWLAALLGGVIAFALFLCWDYINWGASGVDSGPPDGTYAQWVAKNWSSWEPFCTVGVGIVSAVTYHFLATRKPRPVAPGA